MEMSFKHVLMIGKGGVGKSSLANAIWGEHVSPVGELPSNEIKCYTANISEGIYVYDTRGLLDGDDEIDGIVEAIKQVRDQYDLIIACIKFNDRFDLTNRMIFDVISKLEYKNMYIALTNSDIVPADWPRHEIDRRYKMVLGQWESTVFTYLKEKHNMSAGHIRVFPTTHVQVTTPIGPLKYWLHDLTDAIPGSVKQIREKSWIKEHSTMLITCGAIALFGLIYIGYYVFIGDKSNITELPRPHNKTYHVD